MGDVFQNFSQLARDSYENNIKNLIDGTYTGTIGAATLALTSTASLGTANFSGLKSGFNMALTSIASIAVANIYSPSATLNGLLVSTIATANPTVAPLSITASAPSQSFFNFFGATLSTASLNLAANKLAGMVQVTFNGTGGQGIGYLPIFQII